MWVQTSQKIDNDATYTIYRDRDAKHCVKHLAVYRGGCLYIGSVTLFDQNDARSFTFNTTSAPWSAESGPVAANQYWDRHADKLS